MNISEQTLSDNPKRDRGCEGTPTLVTAIREFQKRLKVVLTDRPLDQWSKIELDAFRTDFEDTYDVIREIYERH